MPIVLIPAIPVALVLALTLLQVIHFIPFVGPILKLIGFCYTLWFVYYYFLDADKRRKLLQQAAALKEQSFG